MKRNKNIEMKIYELLGVKIFRKLAFGLRDIIALPITIKMPKEERKKYLASFATNYNIGKEKGLEDIKKFKKMLFMNTGIHIWALSICLSNFLKIVSETASLSLAIINLSCIVVNIYCINATKI